MAHTQLTPSARVHSILNDLTVFLEWVRDQANLPKPLVDKFENALSLWEEVCLQLEKVERETIGYIVYTLHYGEIGEIGARSYELLTKEEAIEKALSILDDWYEGNRFFNKNHPQFDDTCYDEEVEDYHYRKSLIETCKCAELSEDVYLIFAPITSTRKLQ